MRSQHVPVQLHVGRTLCTRAVGINNENGRESACEGKWMCKCDGQNWMRLKNSSPESVWCMRDFCVNHGAQCTLIAYFCISNARNAALSAQPQLCVTDFVISLMKLKALTFQRVFSNVPHIYSIVICLVLDVYYQPVHRAMNVSPWCFHGLIDIANARGREK